LTSNHELWLKTDLLDLLKRHHYNIYTQIEKIAILL
jgi:hypothetical protein